MALLLHNNTHLSMKHIDITICDQALMLLPEKMVFWKEARTLLVADTHFGKAATFRKAGIPVPGGTTAVMLKRLSKVIERHQAQRLIVLGDLVHSATRCEEGFEAELCAWRAQHLGLELMLVRGNHDRGHEALFGSLGMKVVKEPYAESPFAFCHIHDVEEKPPIELLQERPLFRFGGHIHPGVTLKDPGSIKEKAACFWTSKSFMVLPAFGEFTGCATVRPKPGDQFFVVTDRQVLNATLLVKMHNDRR